METPKLALSLTLPSCFLIEIEIFKLWFTLVRRAFELSISGGNAVRVGWVSTLRGNTDLLLLLSFSPFWWALREGKRFLVFLPDFSLIGGKEDDDWGSINHNQDSIFSDSEL